VSRFYRVFINGEERDAIRAGSWNEARRLARALYHVSCDII
jgi:hypothetical protein